ncbi:putative spermidine synthase with an N-terminal membrane domain protein [Rubidibacter lacunae KORDI 51-2]|uniref:Polyamine aminopropyltransferase n=1 Tax=Rubidibacter lacunae KORDI 51-2 TaxID=582515 RepID=U5D7H5_9CHRO|nr:polyamine aminopropyltransferase [Rubidibacter lacunae]ERN40573.1 putative spermidine synthase with an N-terminal membrane domain protein [Rubidibacter lacunae KORDI 51-2]
MRFAARQQRLLLLAAAVSSAVGLAAELLLGTLASYLVGNQALAYGIAVGGFLAAMGLGSYLSQFVALREDRLLVRFVQIELLTAPLAALLPLGLFALFVAGSSLWLGLGLSAALLGTLAGMEVPLLTRAMEHDASSREALASVLALDYVGALFGSLAFPLVLLPVFGLFSAAAFIGSLPALMVVAIAQQFPPLKYWRRWGLLVTVLLWAVAAAAGPIGDRLEDNLYDAPVIYREQSAYQRIVLTRRGRDVRLFLDGDLQFSTLDEYRYHEALVHPALSAVETPRRVLVLGAGDGLALREVLKWPVERVVLVELDPAVVELARTYPVLRRLNADSLRDRRVEIHYGDAFEVTGDLSEQFDAIVADFPDPDRDVLAKLYTRGFYLRLRGLLAPDGVLVTQASSPFFVPRVIACIAATLESAGLPVHPYQTTVPSFGPWGFVLAGRQTVDPARWTLPVATRFLTPELLPSLFALPGDFAPGAVEINRLSRPTIVRYQVDPRWSAYR